MDGQLDCTCDDYERSNDMEIFDFHAVNKVINKGIDHNWRLHNKGYNGGLTICLVNEVKCQEGAPSHYKNT